MEKVILFQNQGKIPENAVITLTVFIKANEVDQRAKYLEVKKEIDSLLRTLFGILDKIRGDNNLSYYVLALINGILEDKRSRVKNFIALQKSTTKKLDIIGILYNFLV